MQATEPRLQATEPRLQATEPRLQATEPRLQATEPRLQATEPRLQATEPRLQATEPRLQATEPRLQASIGSLEYRDSILFYQQVIKTKVFNVTYKYRAMVFEVKLRAQGAYYVMSLKLGSGAPGIVMDNSTERSRARPSGDVRKTS
ncbi:hypothetical protein BgiBS90_019666 [Biomphalaria glabrata]|nr:hypothetical protein BgiBS90_019666 [Biomphalaria glabrata]